MRVLRGLKGMNILSREASLPALFCLLSEKESALKGKNLFPLGANSFFLNYISFKKEFDLKETNKAVTKVIYLVKDCVTILRKPVSSFFLQLNY